MIKPSQMETQLLEHPSSEMLFFVGVLIAKYSCIQDRLENVQAGNISIDDLLMELSDAKMAYYKFVNQANKDQANGND